ncbi:hypothetical protein VDG1235_4440 [Verrucomicrobiia bacterium DG1235]|nr:hypothetical protein VDG1235_4440 [Verrucomicrobiae bacterium DG1235]
MKLRPKTYVIAALITLIAIVILQNTESVDTRILFFTISMPRALLLFVAGLIGAFAGMSFAAFLRRDKDSDKI